MRLQLRRLLKQRRGCRDGSRVDVGSGLAAVWGAVRALHGALRRCRMWQIISGM